MEWVNGIVQGVLLGGLYALFAAGLSLIFGVMRLVNIAHGDLIVVAAYMGYFVIELLGLGPFTSLIVVIPIIAVVGYALQRGLLNFTLGDDLPPLLVTLGLSVIIQNALLMLFTADSRKLDGGSLEVASWKLLEGLNVGVLPIIQFVTAIVVIGVLQLLFYRTAIGRAFRATSDDQEMAQLMGIETRHVFAVAMALSLAVVAIAGIFIAILKSFNPFLGPLLLIYGFEAIIIGGLGSLWGTLAGGVVLGVAQAIGGQINLGLPIIAGHVALFAILLIRPQGLFPKVT
ncbi:MAG TPA: branched-chain amino acid ABC transporter permease [Magnetospirillaceae bacterium]|jgi:branched-chain amino acid transport system permease protein